MFLPRTIGNSLTLIKNNCFDGYAIKSYSQEGEDMILRRIFENQPCGFYVDVGAHHPKRFSNTYYFYKKGWRGINIEAMVGSKKLFNKMRPRDINIEKAVSNTFETLTYYIFNEPALNGFSKDLSQIREEETEYRIIKKIQLQTTTLAAILDKHLPKNQPIDFLSIDVEGLDLKTLLSNNWETYRPSVILVEVLNSSIEKIQNNEEYSFLKKHGYFIFAKSVNTFIFKRID
jgi:FkbM family methyltransferase